MATQRAPENSVGCATCKAGVFRKVCVERRFRAFAPFGANIVAPDARQGLISEDVRVITAGELPDEVFPDTCN